MRTKLALVAGIAALLFQAVSASAQVDVTATAGTPTGSYTTLGAAFTAINAGTHNGDITISITGNTTEATSAILNNSGAGAALYTSVLIQPTVAATITGSIVGAVIKLNGADNVTIDGRIGGVGRNLSVVNTSTAAATAAVWLASVPVGNGASNNVIRNLELACGVDQRASTNSTFGIIQTGTTISVTATNGDDNDNNQFIANRIVRARYGIASRGVTTNNNIAPILTDNIIGPASFGPDQIGKAGIYMQADTGALISRNTIQNVGVLVTNGATGADRFGIAIGAETWSATDSVTITSGDYTVTKNVIHDIVDEKTFSAAGIRLGTTRSGVATNNLVANNFVYNVRANGTAGDQVVGIGYANGHTDRIVFNSINLTGDMDPAGATSASVYGNGIRITQTNGTNNANLTLMDNSIYIDASSNTATVHFYAITANISTYSFGTGGLNYNNYFINAANPQLRTGGLGAVSGAATTTEFLTLANWQAAFTVPQDANSIQADPLYFSPTVDLHLQPASPNIDVGLTIAGVGDDIDEQVRPNGVNPDIGADEFYPSAGSLQFSSSTYSTTETAGTATITVTRATGANGAVQVDYATVPGGTATGGGACGPGVDYIDTSGTLMWADLDVAPKTFLVTICADGLLEPGESVNLALSNVMIATLGTPNTAVLQIQDSGSSVAGSIDVGAGQLFTSLTNSGGLFQSINAGTVTGNVTINVVSDLTGETGAVALNEFAAGFTLTIKPSGAARTISGTTTTLGLIKLNGADNVTIDGSLSGGTDRSLTIMNGNAGATVIWIASLVGNGATNDTVKNCILSGSPGVTAIAGVLAGSGASFGAAAETANSNNTIQSNEIYRVQNSAFLSGVVAGLDQNWLITGNTFGSTVPADKNIFRGMLLGGAQNFVISNNTINGVVSTTTTSSTMTGIQLAAVVNGGTISGNRISDIKHTNPGGFGANGILLGGSSTASNVSIYNNFIWDVAGQGFNGVTVIDNGYGIMVNSGGGYNIRYNTILMGTNQVNPASITAAINIASAVTTAGTLDVRDNIFVNSQTIGTRYAIYDAVTLPAGAAIFSAIDFNDYFSSQHVGFLGGVRTTLADWQTATGQDVSSKAVDPLLVSATDLHLQSTSPLVGMGTPIAGITTDIDNDPRSATAPEIGADELVAADLSVTKLDGPDPVPAGANLTYQITFTNTGFDNAASSSLSDTLPAGTTFVSLSNPGGGWNCTTPPVGSGGTVSCTNPSVGPGDTNFSLTVLVDPALPGGTVLSNTATVASTTFDPNPGNESATATTTVLTFADLSATKTDSPDPVTIGNNLTYTITLTNAGPSNAVAVSLDDTLPAGTTFVSLVSPAGWSCTTPPVGSAGLVSCTNPSLVASSAVFTLKVKVGMGVPPGTVLTNTATAASSTGDPNPGNENGTATTTVAGLADVAIGMTVDNPNPGVGTDVTFTITATNSGPSAATSVQVTDLLRPGLTYVSSVPSVGSYNPTSGVWTLGPLPLVDGGAATLSLVATVTVAEAIVNQAIKTAQGEADPDASDNAALVVLNGPALADVQVQKTVDNAEPGLGTNVTFTVSATNAGPDNATGVELTDLLPGALTFVSATPSQGSYVSGTGVWTVGSIANGATATLQIVATVNSAGSVSNIATKTAQAESDYATGNDSSSVTLNDDTLADLSLSKTASQEPAGLGTTFSYTIVVANFGPATATGVTMTDDLPAGLTLVSASASQGTCTGTTSISCALGQVYAGGSAQVTLVVTKTVGGPVSNIASVSANEGDPNNANNSNGADTTPVELLSFEVE